MNLIKSILLRRFFNKKKQELTVDIELPTWQGVNESDVGVFVTNILLSSGEIARCRLCKVESSTGNRSFNVGFDIEEIGDRGIIRQLSFKEFKKEYSTFFYMTKAREMT